MSLIRLIVTMVIVTSACTLAPRLPAAQAAGVLRVVAVVGGQPDDITTDAQGRLIWGDLARGTIARLDGRRIVTLARGLSVPEGIVALRTGSLVVAEQGRDRIVLINRRGVVTVVQSLVPVPGQEGVDGIGRDPHTGEILIPDSPRGTVLRFDLQSRHVRVAAQGLGRPVDAAVDTHGNILVPDEHLGTLAVISPRGRVSYLGSLATPDDVAVDRSGRIWITTLGDGGLWMVAPGTSPRRVLAGLRNPQGLTLDRCGNPVVVEQNAARIVRLLMAPASRGCSL